MLFQDFLLRLGLRDDGQVRVGQLSIIIEKNKYITNKYLPLVEIELHALYIFNISFHLYSADK